MSAQQSTTFTEAQLDQYFNRIALPQDKRQLSVSSLNIEEQLQYLQTLLKHAQTCIPFENITQHYSWHRVIDLDPLHLFRKIVLQPGRGGYCMENNSFFHSILTALGFKCYLAAGRVWQGPGGWTGWSHIVVLVIIGGTKYLCDIGNGPREPIAPLPLVEGEVRQHVGSAESRLVFDTLPENTTDCKLWIYQHRFESGQDWETQYCFTEMELLPGDLPAMNLFPWLSRTLFFTKKVICVRFTTADEGKNGVDSLPSEAIVSEDEIDGTLTLNHDMLKWRRRGEEVMSVRLKSEEERVAALKKYWGIELDIEDRQAILGTVAAIDSEAGFAI